MRLALAVLLSLTAGAALNSASVEPARADQYKWCALYNGGETGASANCYFVTRQQCEWAVSGVGGFCAPSPYDGNRPASSWTQTPASPAIPAPGKKKS